MNQIQFQNQNQNQNQNQTQNQFTTKNNVDLLWDVLLDENYVKKMNDPDKLKLKELFNNQRNIF